MVMTKDFGAILSFYLLSVYIFFTARNYPVQPHIPMPQNPGFYPILLSGLLILLATIHLIQMVLTYRREERDSDVIVKRERFWGESSPLTRIYLGISALMLFVFMFLFNWLGFASATFLFLSVQSRLLAPKETKTIKVLGFSLLATAVIFIIFSLLIGIRFPQGLLL